MNEERVVFLPDIHVPHHIPLEGVWGFLQDFHPTQVILGGDAHDWGAVCLWIADQSRYLSNGVVRENYTELEKVVLEPLQKAAPKARKIYMMGNHENWLEKAIELCPNGRGFWELEKNIDLKKYRMEVVSFNKVHKVSEHLYYLHGLYTNEFHAKKTAQAYHKTVLYGHCHDQQTFTIVSPIDETQFIKGQSCGCLCNLNPHYAKERPNRWVHGFNYAVVDKETGYFWDTQVTIVDGRFFSNGKMY